MARTYKYRYTGNCGECGKVKFKSEEIAKAKLSTMVKNGREEKRYYYCRRCMAWHVTSRERKLLFDDENGELTKQNGD